MAKDYEFLDKYKLCHRCQKQRQAPGRVTCLDCLDKASVYNTKHYSREKMRERLPKLAKQYQEKKANGICVKCSKKATHGIYCYECSVKQKRSSIKYWEKEKQKRYERGISKEYRKEHHLCFLCGKIAVQGKLICKEHQEIWSNRTKEW